MIGSKFNKIAALVEPTLCWLAFHTRLLMPCTSMAEMINKRMIGRSALCLGTIGAKLKKGSKARQPIKLVKKVTLKLSNSFLNTSSNTRKMAKLSIVQKLKISPIPKEATAPCFAEIIKPTPVKEMMEPSQNSQPFFSPRTMRLMIPVIIGVKAKI